MFFHFSLFFLFFNTCIPLLFLFRLLIFLTGHLLGRLDYPRKYNRPCNPRGKTSLQVGLQDLKTAGEIPNYSRAETPN